MINATSDGAWTLPCGQFSPKDKDRCVSPTSASPILSSLPSDADGLFRRWLHIALRKSQQSSQHTFIRRILTSATFQLHNRR